jgi:uroporphyrinogen-III synthase
MASLLSRRGLQPISAPSMKEAPLDDQTQALAFGEVLLAGDCDVLVLLTGVGTRMLIDALRTRWGQAEIVAALGATTLLARGPKPVAALKALGLRPTLVAPSPNTHRELIAAIDAAPGGLLAGKRVWVQEYGRSNAELMRELGRRAAEVRAVPIYAWRLPDDIAPLRQAIALLCQGEAEAVLFTSARQLDHLLQVADQLGRRDELERALRERVVVASIGPVTSEALRDEAIAVDVEPELPKMGQLVRALAEQGLECLERKRGVAG